MCKADGGFFSGTNGSDKILIDELKRRNEKFTEEDIQFITRDTSGNIVWLESGNPKAGLTHIIERHEKDFKDKCNISKEELPNFLNEVFSNGEILYNGIVNEKPGYTRIIKYKDNYFFQAGVGTNGFIISTYPISKKTAQKNINKFTNSSQ